MASPKMNDVCAICSKEFGDHGAFGTECPTNNPSSGTPGVWGTTKFAAMQNGVSCNNCNYPQNNHSSTMSCPVKGTAHYHSVHKFMSPAMVKNAAIKTAVALKHISYDELVKEARAKEKPKSIECPCGIMRVSCTYHKEA